MNPASILDGLLPALKRLDHLIRQAVAAMQADEGPARDPFRGVHVDPDNVARCLAREPGEPLFDSAPEVSADDIPSDSPRFGWLAQAFGLSSSDLGTVLIALAPDAASGPRPRPHLSRRIRRGDTDHLLRDLAARRCSLLYNLDIFSSP